MRPIPDSTSGEEFGEIFQLGEQARTLGQVRVRRFTSRGGVGLHHRVGRIRGAQREKCSYVLGRVGDLRIFPASDADDPPCGAVHLVVEREQQVILLQPSVDRSRRESPP